MRKIAYYVQSVPQRREIRRRLLATIPPAVVIEDDGPPPPSPWRGYQLCLRAFLESEATHALIVQDDAVVCRHFAETIEKIAQACPDVPVAMFVSATRSHSMKYYLKAMAAKKSYSTIWFQDFLPVVAVLWPREKAEEFLQWAKDAKLPGTSNPRSDDAVAGSWMKFTRQTVLATVPSLVEHPDDVPSVKGGQPDTWGKAKNRQALWYIGDHDPLEYDWSIV